MNALSSSAGADTSALPSPLPALLELERTPDPGAEQAGFVRLHRNERVQPLPGWFLDRIRQALTGDLLTSYPETQELYDELAASLGVDRRRLLLTSGSDGAVKAIHHAYVRPGDGVVALDPSYAMYGVYAAMFGAHAITVPFEPGPTLDEQRLLDAITPGVRLVMLANPNQPTGTAIAEPVLLEVLERAGRVGALVAIDEAYFPFSKATMLGHVEHIPHLLVTRTFSKAAGLAGLRIGFVAGDPTVVENLSKLRSAHDVNAMAVACARELLRSPEVVDDCVAQTDAGKQVLADRASALGLEPLPTHANFMLLRVAPQRSPQAVVDALRAEGYLVRGPFAAPSVADCVRVTLGPPGLMSAFGDALERALARVDGR